MKKCNVIMAAVLSMAVLFGANIPVNAASAEVTIEVKETIMDNVSVTVPTTLPIIFNEDGSNTLPTNWTIENISTIAGIHLAEVEMDGTESGWQILGNAENTKLMKVNTKAMKFSLGKSGALKLVEPTNGTKNAVGTITFGDEEITIASGEEQVLDFNVERGAFTSSQASQKAFDMVLTFEFN